MWSSRRQSNGHAVVFCGDRGVDAVTRSSHGDRRLDDQAGLSWVCLRLAQLRTRLAGTV
jgi:hypothetical protein